MKYLQVCLVNVVPMEMNFSIKHNVLPRLTIRFHYCRKPVVPNTEPWLMPAQVFLELGSFLEYGAFSAKSESSSQLGYLVMLPFTRKAQAFRDGQCLRTDSVGLDLLDPLCICLWSNLLWDPGWAEWQHIFLLTLQGWYQQWRPSILKCIHGVLAVPALYYQSFRKKKVIIGTTIGQSATPKHIPGELSDSRQHCCGSADLGSEQ